MNDSETSQSPIVKDDILSLIRTMQEEHRNEISLLRAGMEKQNKELVKEIQEVKQANEKLQSQFDELKKKNDVLISIQSSENLSGNSSEKRKLGTHEDQQSTALINKKIKGTSDGASFNDLSDDLLHDILLFTGKESYIMYGLLNKQCNALFDTFGYPKESSIFGYAPVSLVIRQKDTQLSFFNYWRKDVLDWFLEIQDKKRLEYICRYALRRGYIPLLEKVYGKVNSKIQREWRINGEFCHFAASSNQLQALQWLRANNFEWGDMISEFQQDVKDTAVRGYLCLNNVPGYRIQDEGGQPIFPAGTYHPHHDRGVHLLRRDPSDYSSYDEMSDYYFHSSDEYDDSSEDSRGY